MRKTADQVIAKAKNNKHAKMTVRMVPLESVSRVQEIQIQHVEFAAQVGVVQMETAVMELLMFAVLEHGYLQEIPAAIVMKEIK